ncbi:hypothetical protein [Collimonas sp. OK607]|uniref:hypothetical protein n=1 Tax=Collimonas sp. OK607 TaxID=1798194 RepID=UPI000B859BDF|nr:hypothetical protein [Collimonas sp. OK607]
MTIVKIAKLTTALSTNLSGIQNLFSSATGTTGIGAQMSTLLTTGITGSGLSKTATDGLNSN